MDFTYLYAIWKSNTPSYHPYKKIQIFIFSRFDIFQMDHEKYYHNIR